MTVTPSTPTLPAAGTYQIDPSHSSASFMVRHLGLAKVRGRFAGLSGALVLASPPEASHVTATIPAADIDTRDHQRDQHLRSPDFLDVERYPTLEFRSTTVRQEDGDWLVDGELTIRGVTRPVTLAVGYEGTATDPWGGQRLGFSAHTEIDREDFGLTWNQPLEAGGLLVGKKVKIELDVELVKQGDQ